MPRFFLRPSLRQLKQLSRPVFGLCLAFGALGSSPRARADEFSVLPARDPIAIQLGLLSTALPSASLTRYEAALQTARVILAVQNREAGTTSRVEWRALAALCLSLKNELKQLGVDAGAARALALQNLKTEEKSAPLRPESPNRSPQAATGTRARDAKANLPRAASFLTPELLSNSKTGALPKSSDSLTSGGLELRLSPRLRVDAALQGAPRAASIAGDRFAPRAPLQGQLDDESARPGALGSQTGLSYDLSRFLTLRAANSRLDWSAAAPVAGENPLLGAPLFAGARGVRGAGGGVDLSLGDLKFGAEVERLRADSGALASRIGGGASVSAFGDRLLLNMSLSRLLPGEPNALAATAAQASAWLDVSPRLSLNLKYQGLFAPTPNESASRVGGGVSLKF